MEKNLELENKIYDAFYKFFRDEKGYKTWSNEDIDISINDDDLLEFIAYIFRFTTRDRYYNLDCLKKILENGVKNYER